MKEQQALKYLKDANRNNQMVGILPKSDIGKCLINALEVNQQYRAIGTVEECRAAAEKQKTKRADLSVDGHSDGDMVCGTYECPNCGEYYELGYDEYEYCPNCGQHMKVNMEGEEDETD